MLLLFNSKLQRLFLAIVYSTTDLNFVKAMLEALGLSTRPKKCSQSLTVNSLEYLMRDWSKKGCHDIQQIDSKDNDTQHNCKNVELRV